VRERIRTEPCLLATGTEAKAVDLEAVSDWALRPDALVEAAGRACAAAFSRALPQSRRGIAVLAGSGNNAADALVMLRALILDGRANPASCRVIVPRPPDSDAGSLAGAGLVTLRRMGVAVSQWHGGPPTWEPEVDTIIDGITGTGIDGPLRGTALEMATAINSRTEGVIVVSIDVPSGAFDGMRPGTPSVRADFTLAVEPVKLCLYSPSVRPNAGKIIPVGGIFPEEQVAGHCAAELLSWECAAARIPGIPPHVHKYGRGVVEIRAGSPGAVGAARLAAIGCQAAGAGIVRLLTDDAEVHDALAGAFDGVMVVPPAAPAEEGRFSPSAALLGPGWGVGADRAAILEGYLDLESRGLPLVLDADALALAGRSAFHGNAILTPHVGEFARLSGLDRNDVLADPVGAAGTFAKERNATVLLKSHVTHVASPDGRIGVIDGMNPTLASGGSGDLLAGFCAAIAARTGAENRFDGYDCACAAAALLMRAAEPAGRVSGFADPGELARVAARVAGGAWIRRP
jgi:NAD(P)H-hydrate epimerase